MTSFVIESEWSFKAKFRMLGIATNCCTSTRLNKRLFSITKSSVLAERLRAVKDESVKPTTLIIIDVRERENYVKGHIKSAVNIDSRDLMKWRALDKKLLNLIETRQMEGVEPWSSSFTATCL